MFNKSKYRNFLDTVEHPLHAVENMPYFKKKKRSYYFFKFLKYFSISVLAAFIMMAGMIAVNLTPLKSIYQKANAGKNSIQQAAVALKEKRFVEAEGLANEARRNFRQSAVQLSAAEKSLLISRLPLLRGEFNNIVYLLNSAEVLSRALGEISRIGAELEWFFSRHELNFASLNRGEKEHLLKKIFESGPEINGIKADVELALLNLNNVRADFLLWPAKGRIFDLKTYVEQIRDFLKTAAPATQILPSLLGYPKNAVYLVLLQNNDELRPTGGFIGTYGILELEFGDIKRFDTHDIYHMDMPVKDRINIVPPEPIKKYLVPKWYMRDANWSPDWPTAAEKIQWFYKLENDLLPPKNQINNFSGKFDGVIGITPKVAIDLLKMTGPVTIDGTEYRSENFMELLQYRVERGYMQLGIPSWERKEVIGEIFKEMKIKLFDLSPVKFISIMDVAGRNLDQKNIILFFNDPELQSYADEERWTGRIINVKGDFLQIVDANMGSFKTDDVISRSFDYKLTNEKNGLIADLRINYMHKGQFDYKTTRYRTYTRIYVPKGSKLLRAEGFTQGKIDIYEELEKTVFGVFLSVEPGQIGNLRFIYNLPENIYRQISTSGYSLLIQKQPGTESVYHSVDLEFNNIVKSYSPTGFYAQRFDDGVRWEGELLTDMEYAVGF